jgi:hypothetical protein
VEAKSTGYEPKDHTKYTWRKLKVDLVRTQADKNGNYRPI